MLTMIRETKSGTDRITATIKHVVIAGWAARDAAAVHHHIEELAALGVPRPSTVPVFYRVGCETLTQSHEFQVLGNASSGEIEPVIVCLTDGLWVGVGSDHTDRKAEVHGVALSKQLCGKVVGTTFWPIAEVADHWDQLELRSTVTIDGVPTTYQQGSLASLRTPWDLMSRYRGEQLTLEPGTIMFGGTLGAIGGVRPAAHFAMELTDPILKRRIAHEYAVHQLPVVT
jgi:hypothetical protein